MGWEGVLGITTSGVGPLRPVRGSKSRDSGERVTEPVACPAALAGRGASSERMR